MNKHRLPWKKRDEKIPYLKKHWRETRGHIFNFEQVEVLATGCMEDPRKIIKAVHTKLRKTSNNKAVEVTSCYYQVLKKKKHCKIS